MAKRLGWRATGFSFLGVWGKALVTDTGYCAHLGRVLKRCSFDIDGCKAGWSLLCDVFDMISVSSHEASLELPLHGDIVTHGCCCCFVTSH
jgi:hypothetical protein